MRFAFILYDGITLLDFAGVYDPVTRLKSMGISDDLSYDVCAMKEDILTFEGLHIQPDKTRNDLSEYDYVFLPGGYGVAQLLGDKAFLQWIKSVKPGANLAAVCGGSLVLGAAGYLQGKRATTHPALMEYLKKFTDQAANDRIVEDGNVITARGVTSAIDLGLYLAEKLAGRDARQKIQKQMDYTAYPHV